MAQRIVVKGKYIYFTSLEKGTKVLVGVLEKVKAILPLYHISDYRVDLTLLNPIIFELPMWQLFGPQNRT